MLCWRRSGGTFKDRERLEEVKVFAVERELGMAGLAPPSQRCEIFALEIRAQALAPGIAENRFLQIQSVGSAQRRQSLDEEGSRLDALETCRAQQTDSA